MSDVVIADYGRNPARERAAGRSVFWIKVFAAISAALILLELVISFFVLPQFRSPKMIYSPTRNYTRKELDEALRGADRGSWLGFDVRRGCALLSELPGVESADIRRQFPDKIIVTISERVPVALTILEEGGNSVPVQIDRNGMLFRRMFGEQKKGAVTAALPLVTGLPIEDAGGQPRIPARYRELMEKIGRLNSLPSKFFAAISEIHVVPKQHGNFELVLYPVHSKIRVLLDRNFDETVLENMMVALDVVERIGTGAQELDLRYGSISSR